MFRNNKPTGMEMMLQSILKSMGITPETLAGHIATAKELATRFVQAMEQIRNEQREIHAEQLRQRDMLAKLLSYHDVPSSFNQALDKKALAPPETLNV